MGGATVKLLTRQARPLSDEVEVIEVRSDGYLCTWRHLQFIVSDELHGGRWWRHASVSRLDNGMPSYDDLVALKRLTIGADREAVQVFPRAEDHIDIAGPAFNMEVLHLWSPFGRSPLPDFGRYGAI